MKHKFKKGSRVWLAGKWDDKLGAHEYVVKKPLLKYDLIPADPKDGRTWAAEEVVFATEAEALAWIEGL